MAEKLHTISVFVANNPGVLLRVAIIFARRGFNIESLVVSSALDGRFSRMTITAKGKEEILEQIVKQLNKLVDVVHSNEYIPGDSVSIETALLKILVKSDNRTEVLQVVDHLQLRCLHRLHRDLIWIDLDWGVSRLIHRDWHYRDWLVGLGREENRDLWLARDPARDCALDESLTLLFEPRRAGLFVTLF